MPNDLAEVCMKCLASNGISSLRSRNDGKRKRITFKRWNKSSLNKPSATLDSKFWCVAAITRTLDLSESCPPTR